MIQEPINLGITKARIENHELVELEINNSKVKLANSLPDNVYLYYWSDGTTIAYTLVPNPTTTDFAYVGASLTKTAISAVSDDSITVSGDDLDRDDTKDFAIKVQ